MFCQNCGKEIDDKAVVCVHCGCATNNTLSTSTENKSWSATLLLCLFLGGLGAHRFYVGKNSSAIAILLLNLLLGWLIIPLIITGLWVIIDLIMICTGDFKTIDGKNLVK